jgi:hypothetical protein
LIYKFFNYNYSLGDSFHRQVNQTPLERYWH